MPFQLLRIACLLTIFMPFCAWGDVPVVHSTQGERMVAEGLLIITNVGKKQNYDFHDSRTLDAAVLSPKSVVFHPDGSRYYVNSLEGCATVVYDAKSQERIKVIRHAFKSGAGALWSKPSGYYRFTHYPDGPSRAFSGKPVESEFSHGGRYLWVPFYRRTFDLNAQDPSAVAIIDTRTDSIVHMMETGPLPKMIKANHTGTLMAVTHWGNNTVGLIDISSDSPAQWHHLPPVVIEKEFVPDFSLTIPVNRDAHSGLLLRGTVFTPDDRYLLVGCMGGGGIAVVDMASAQPRYLGKVGGIYNARHLIVSGNYLYASVNAAGIVQRIPFDSLTVAIERRSGSYFDAHGWQSCKVGGGARTIEASPGGRFIFAACNTASALYVVDTRHMRTVGRIAVDSYPVGLDIARDGHFLVVTSQGRDGLGGNAVNLFRIDYLDGNEEKAARAAIEAIPDTAAAVVTDAEMPCPTLPERFFHPSTTWIILMGAGVAAVVAGAAATIIRRKKKRKVSPKKP